MKAILLDTDGSVQRQELDRHFNMDTVNLADIRNNLQFYAARRAVSECAHRVGRYGAMQRNIYLLGSGDFHHLTLLLLEQIDSPFAFIVFDNHTDCSFPYPKYHCGNWMYHAARLKMCKMILHVGATEKHGALGRLALSTLVQSGKLKQLPGAECVEPDGVDKFKKLVFENGFNTLPVYVSIDKDVLCGDEAPGDWDNGIMKMSILSKMLESIMDNCSIAGADITGEHGGKFHYRQSPLKNLFSFLEHPGQRQEPLFEIDAKQRIINLEIMEIFGAGHVAH
ncbi:MAG: arginase family protein [Deltaproteobacteria bacterium]|nr:arginase family protein [Deltaproteobacteria bacterium]